VPFQPRCSPPTDLVRPVPIDPAGVAGPTRGQASGHGWRRTGRNLYVPAEVDASRPEQRVLEQAARLPPRGAVTGWASLRLAGAAYFDGLHRDGRRLIPVPLVVGPTGRLRQGLGAQVSCEPFADAEVRIIAGIPCTVVRRALFDEMRRPHDVRESVVAMDMAAAAGLASIRQMRLYYEDHRAFRRAGQVTQALDLASEESRSPAETRMRLVWVLDARLPPPRVNQPVFDLSGKLLGIADLFDEEAGVVGEYDGAEHRGATRHTKDVGREDAFRRAGLEYFKVTSLDMHHKDRVVDRMQTTRKRGRFEPQASRGWTLTLPPDWQPKESLDERFAMAAWLEQQMREERLRVVAPPAAY
jgi:hypothetical protein